MGKRADMEENSRSEEDDNSGSQSGCATAWIWPIGLIALGAAMLAWPGAVAPLPGPCDPGPDGELLACLIGEWGKPEAITVCFVVGLLMAVSAMWQRLRTRAG